MHESAFLHLVSNDSSFSGTSNAARSRVIETKYGKVQGLSITLFPNSQHHQGKNNIFKNKIVEVYLGIPYASPPIKTHRFSPTQTPIPWDGIKSTVKPGFVCPQMMPDIRNESAALNEMPKGYLEYLRKIEPFFRNQSEDCLYLNIYTPIGAEQKLRPVLVYIHGGKFAWGSGNLSDGTVMAAYADVLFVTLNYRLGVLGFLNTNPSPSTKPRVANYGLMDQIAALHWIKENVMSFGGDPENITLMGYEAGAACIHFLMSSPAVTPGLFHRSILIAGSSHAPWALVPDPSAAATALSQALNCTSVPSSGFPQNNLTASATPATTTTTQAPQNPHGKSTGPFSSNQDPILDCLKNKHFSYFTKFYPPKFSVDFGPSIDGVVIRNNYRVPGEGQMGKRDVSKKYDLLFGTSSLEKLTAFSEGDLEFGFEAQRRDAILRTLVRNSYRFHLNEILATITNEYTDWEKSVQHPIATRDLTVNAVTDCMSVAPVVAASDSPQIRKSYFYVFEHSTKDGLYNYQRSGAGGGEEVNYILGVPLMDVMMGPALPFVPPPLPSNYSKNEMALSELIINYISNFVHNGDPNEPLKSEVTWPVSKERNRYKNIAWEPYDRLHQKYLEISTNKIRTRTHYRAHQMAVWLRLVPELQKSGAQFASTLHNRLKGGSDPSLYVGSPRLLPFEEEMANNELDSYDSGQANFGPDNSPPSPPTTCFSPLSASTHGNANADGSSVSTSSFGKTTNSKFNETSLEPSYFTPYSTALSITIAIGCSLLILNVFIFALVYYQRDKKRAEKMKSSHGPNGGHQSNPEDQNKYGEPPELLKSNSTTASTLHHSMSQSQLQSLVQSDTCHSHGSFNIQHQGNAPSSHGHSHSHQQHQQYNKQRDRERDAEQISMGQMGGLVLSPAQTHHGQQTHPNLLQHSASVPPQMLAVATLPRSNGGVGAQSKPQPPPRTTTGGTGTHTNFSTLPHNIHWSAQNLYFVILFGYIICNIIS